MKRFICIHAHFYQPPRENPWLEAIEAQESAHPYHDWNEKITAQCYAPNANSRILKEGKIFKIVNNYEQISFNYGPTLLTWIKEKKPYLFEKIILADKESQKKFGGHGAAIAQVYNHMILPLANTKDKYTQIYWGMRYFELIFGRKSEGMWLAETAVDLESLDIMADLGIKFTILAPHQAKSFKSIDSSDWQDVSNAKIDTKIPYLLRLPSGRTITLFFYEGLTAKAIAFEKLLNNGEEFANKLLSLFQEDNSSAQLVHIATDGETYGHHHPSGDMSLAYALKYLGEKTDVTITVYGQFLQMFPAIHEVIIYENSSWSCLHGIERWKNDCGCNAGHQNWNQKWRKPLRESLNWLRDILIELFDVKTKKYIHDPSHLRNDYIEILHNKIPAMMINFVIKHANCELSESNIIFILKSLEIQRQLMQMFTSCGWFFDEISGIETIKILEYACRAIQLAEEIYDIVIEDAFMDKLALIPTNISEFENGKKIYQKFVQPQKLNLKSIAAAYAIKSIFFEYRNKDKFYCYYVQSNMLINKISCLNKLQLGDLKIKNRITMEIDNYQYIVFYQGDLNLNCGLKIPSQKEELYKLHKELYIEFEKGDYVQLNGMLIKHFKNSIYTIKNIFKDEQKKIINNILKFSLEKIDIFYTQYCNCHASMIFFLKNINMPLPKPFEIIFEHALNNKLKNLLQIKYFNTIAVNQLIEDAITLNLDIHTIDNQIEFENFLNKIILLLIENKNNVELLNKALEILHIINKYNFKINLWEAQNHIYNLLVNNNFRFNNLQKKLIYELANNLKIDINNNEITNKHL